MRSYFDKSLRVLGCVALAMLVAFVARLSAAKSDGVTACMADALKNAPTGVIPSSACSGF